MAGMESGEAEGMHRASPDAAANKRIGDLRVQTASQDSGASIGGGGESSLVSAGAPSTVLSVPGRRLNATGPGLGFLPDTLIMAGNDTSGVINILCAACAQRRRREPACTEPCVEPRGRVATASSLVFYPLLPCHESKAAALLCPGASQLHERQLMKLPGRQALIILVRQLRSSAQVCCAPSAA